MPKFKINNQRKYILIASAVLLCLGIIYRFLPSFEDLVSPSEEIELKETQLIKYQKMVRNAQGLDSRLVSLQGTLKELESGLLTGKTAALAAVDIQNILHKIASKSKVEIKRVKMLKPKEVDQGNYLSVPVEFEITLTTRQLKEILYRLRSSPKYLTVEKVRTRYTKRSGQIYSNITVSGFMKRAES